MIKMSDISGYPEYYISSEGRVFSKDRLVAGVGGSERFIKGVEKKIQKNKEGIPIVQISRVGEKRSCMLASLLAESFLGYNHEKQQICYRDGDKSNVKLSNIVVVDRECTIKVTPEHYDLLTRILSENKK